MYPLHHVILFRHTDTATVFNGASNSHKIQKFRRPQNRFELPKTNNVISDWTQNSTKLHPPKSL